MYEHICTCVFVCICNLMPVLWWKTQNYHYSICFLASVWEIIFASTFLESLFDGKVELGEYHIIDSILRSFVPMPILIRIKFNINRSLIWNRKKGKCWYIRAIWHLRHIGMRQELIQAVSQSIESSICVFMSSLRVVTWLILFLKDGNHKLCSHSTEICS